MRERGRLLKREREKERARERERGREGSERERKTDMPKLYHCNECEQSVVYM